MKNFENAASDGFGWNTQNSLSEDHKILHTYGRLTNLPDRTSLAAAGWLHNAIKYGTKVHKMGSADQRVE